MVQDYLLYFPTKAAVAELISPRLAPWPAASNFRGLVAEPIGSEKGTAIVFHGNAGHAGHRDFYAAILNRLGLRVILAEYPGYGPRDGQPSERGLVEDAKDTIVQAQKQYKQPLLLIGESLGAAVAAAAAGGLREQIAGLLLITPWDRIDNVAAHHYGWLPIRWFVHDHYDNVDALASFDRPVVVVVAERDSIVPPRYGLSLYKSLTAPKRLKSVSGADHNDWIYHVDAHWWRDVIGFLLPK